MKNKEEKKAVINKYLQENNIKGFLAGDVLYMQSLGNGPTPYAYLLVLGFFVLGVFLGARLTELIFSYYGLGAFIVFAVGFVGVFLSKGLLVYDINKNVIYTLNSIGKKEIWRSKEIDLNTVKEFVVDNDYADSVKSPCRILDFKGDLLDNPHITTVLACFTADNKLLRICEPRVGREPYQISVSRCKMFAECFDVQCEICKKDEYIKLGKSQDGKTFLMKLPRIMEWQRASDDRNFLQYIFLGLLLASFFGFLFFSSK